MKWGIHMPSAEAKKRAKRKWDGVHCTDYWHCKVAFRAEEKKMITDRAAELGQTVSDYIRDLVFQDIHQEEDHPGVFSAEDIDLPDFGE